MEIPKVVDAVAAYPSEEAWRRDVGCSDEQPHDMTAAEALVQLSYPLLLPRPGGDEADMLRRAVDLALNDEYTKARAAFYDWLRDFIRPLRSEGAALQNTALDPASHQLAQTKLAQLWQAENAILAEVDKDRFWARVEIGSVSVGAIGSVALACAAAFPALGAGVGLLTFAGWAINKWRTPDRSRDLGGASMFVEAKRRLDWLEPRLA